MEVKEVIITENLCKSFGGIHALKDVTISIQPQELVGLIGPNGSGKTTFINCLSGYYKPDKGRIIFCGRDITGLASHKIFRLGLARTFQITRLYWDLTVLENIRIPIHFLKVPEDQAEKMVRNVLTLFDLDKKRNMQAKILSTFEQKKLEIAMRLVGYPKMLLLDEPAAGLSQEEINELITILKLLHTQGLTILIVEHTMRVIFGICNRVIVLNEGNVIADGEPKEIISNKAVIEAYLGTQAGG